jgi:hypothetical protein
MGKTTRVVAGLVMLVLAHGGVVAQPPPPPPLPPPPPGGGGGPAPAAGPMPERWIGVGLVMIPSGTLTFEGGGMEASESMATAFGAELLATRQFAPNLNFVAAPRFLTGIKGAEATESATQLDLRLGLSYSQAIQPNLIVFGYGVTGFSMIFPPFDEGEETFTPGGLLIGFGGGGGFLVGPRTMLYGSLGYQLGFQSTSIQGMDVTLKDDLLDFTFGILAGLG